MKTLLIIDRDIENHRELCSLLADEYSFIEFDNVRDGKSFLAENGAVVAAVLLKPCDPSDDLDDFLEYVQRSADFSTIPVLMLVDDVVAAEASGRLGHGFVDCIGRPYYPAVIRNRISNAIMLKDSLTFYGIEKMLKALPSNIYLKDKEGRYIFATHYWHHLDHSDDPDWTIRGKTDPDIRKDKENAIAAQKKDMEILENGRGAAYTIEINADGIQEFYDIVKEPVFDDAGNVNGIIGLVHDVTEHELLKREFHRQATTDELTGLHNRVYFYEYMRELPKKDLFPVSLISTDCDNLKKINDTYGHMAGDEYLKMSAQLFRKVLPSDCVMFRMGGDEFLLLLPSTDAEQAAEYVSQMKQAETQFHIGSWQLSISFGIATLTGQNDSLEKCLSQSDQNMYREKKAKHGIAKE